MKQFVHKQKDIYVSIYPEDMGMGRAQMIDPDSLEFGPELDQLVAEKIMGHLADYSTDISAAWEVVEKIINQDHDGTDYWVDIRITSTPNGKNPMDYRPLVWVSFYPTNHRRSEYEYMGAIGEADTLPLAICRAALKAMEKE